MPARPDSVFPLGDLWRPPADNDVATLPDGIAVSRPNQGVLCTQVALMGANGGGWLAINVYEDTPAFIERFEAWVASDKAFLEYIDTLHGFHGYMPRGVIPEVVFIAPGYDERGARVQVMNEVARRAKLEGLLR